MKQFHITLNVEVNARDQEQALEIAGELVAALMTDSVHPYKVAVEVDSVEEA